MVEHVSDGQEGHLRNALLLPAPDEEGKHGEPHHHTTAQHDLHASCLVSAMTEATTFLLNLFSGVE